MDKPEPIWAYLVWQLTVDSGQLELSAGYVPQPVEGSIILSADSHGKGTKTVEFEDGPVKTYADLVFLGEGERDHLGNITFDLGVKRLLNLVNLGLEHEQVMLNQIHEFASAVQTKIEPLLVSPVKSEDFVGDVLRAVDDVERHFWDRKR